MKISALDDAEEKKYGTQDSEGDGILLPWEGLPEDVATNDLEQGKERRTK
jgi:hypothetical protein|tara:strand:- start:246 stop:395 length:150 start_codon:yes stop_codon:yes gene_type:complete